MNSSPLMSPNNDLTTSLQVQSIRNYLEVESALQQCEPEIQEVVASMISIFRSPESTQDERQGALYTIVEALFPLWSADYLAHCEGMRQSQQADEVRETMAQEDATFAERLTKIMQERGLTQCQLGDMIGVSQPAIANMLNRNVRPQRKTVVKFAVALGVAPTDLWPGLKQ